MTPETNIQSSEFNLYTTGSIRVNEELLNHPNLLAVQSDGECVRRPTQCVKSYEAAKFSEWIERYEERILSPMALQYARDVNRFYDELYRLVELRELVELRLMRSIWAKQCISLRLQELKTLLVSEEQAEENKTANKSSALTARFSGTMDVLAAIRGFLSADAIADLVDAQDRVGNAATAAQLSLLLANFADPVTARPILQSLDSRGIAMLRLGPRVLAPFRPIRKCIRKYNPNQWLSEAEMSEVEFVDGDPDRIRVRGIELRSGDIGVVELNYPGDGIHESFLTEPGLAPHAMLYVTRRIARAEGDVLYQPCLVEIYEGGWRCVPVTTGLSPQFSWYSEWLRPAELPAEIGERITRVLDRMETIAFDFQSRCSPEGGVFPEEWGQPSATCTNLIRIIYERAGAGRLQYLTTPVAAGARKNLATIGIDLEAGIYTPSNLLADRNFTKVGIVDNGRPEMSFAQAIVLGRPEIKHSIGGIISQRRLQLERLPNWRSVRQWRSACEALLIAVGQSSNPLASLARTVFGYTKDEIPLSASDTAIAFYLRNEFVMADIVRSVVYPEVVRWFAEGGTFDLSAMREDASLCEIVRQSLANSDIERERWYASLDE